MPEKLFKVGNGQKYNFEQILNELSHRKLRLYEGTIDRKTDQ